MTYTTKDLFEDCATRNKRVGATKPFASGTYSQVWDAVTRWVDSQLNSRRGASLQGFATITYRKTERGGTTASKSLEPVFLLHEGFSRSNMMATRRSAPTIKELTINEEMNFSKLAFVFMDGVPDMKKDTITSCWKSMVLRIGEVMKGGSEMRLDFGVGVLIARDRKVDFNFRASFQPVKSATPSAEPVRSPSSRSSVRCATESEGSAMDSSAQRHLSSRTSSHAPDLTTQPAMARFATEGSSATASRRTSNAGSAAGERGGSAAAPLPPAAASSDEGTANDLMVINKKRLTARSCALSDAETRQKVNVARQKREDERIEIAMRRQLAEGNAKAEGIHKENVQREYDLGQFLKKQIAEKHMKKTKETTERRSTKLECDAVTCIPSEKIDDQEDLRLAASRAQYAADLTKQILHKKMAMINDYEEDQVEHITRLERTTRELEETLSKRQGDRLQKQKQLSSAWKIQLGEKTKKRMHKV